MTAETTDRFNPLRYWNDRPSPPGLVDQVDAELDREDSLSERYAFQLGHEAGLFRLLPPSDSNGKTEWPHPEMARGYVHGLQQTPRRSDVYLRKLLKLKINAFARQIPVSSALTVDYLRSITVLVCPVSGANLTQGTMSDSDWSVDRLVNCMGYVPGNVCVVSTRVNALKGQLDFDTLYAEMTSIDSLRQPDLLQFELDCGLTVLEGMRLASLMAGPQGNILRKPICFAPMAMAPGIWATIEMYVASLHVACARSRVEGAAYLLRHGQFKRLGKNAWHISNRLVEAVRAKLDRGFHPADIWMEQNIIFPLFELIDLYSADLPKIDGVTPESVSQERDQQSRALSNYMRSPKGLCAPTN